MKQYCLLIAFLICTISFAQENDIYFPQEQLVIKECEESDNTSTCLYYHLESKISAFISSPKVQKRLMGFDKDTLKIGGTLIVDGFGKIVREKSGLSFYHIKLNERFKNSLDKILFQLSISTVKNKKPSPYISRHPFTFHYKIKKNNGTLIIEHIDYERRYSGGVIEEVPRFPGCESFSEKEAVLCFQTKMQEHIRLHFRYPKAAQRKKIEGKVYLMFIINKEGEISKIRTRGPDEILENEAIRIIQLLPKMKPGKQNGKPVNVPFSIPINYKLQ